MTLPDAEVLRLYRLMVLNRSLDERMITLQRQGRIGFYIGSIGEEASGARHRRRACARPTGSSRATASTARRSCAGCRSSRFV